MKTEILSDRAALRAWVPRAIRRANLTVTTRQMSHGIADMGLALEVSTAP